MISQIPIKSLHQLHIITVMDILTPRVLIFLCGTFAVMALAFGYLYMRECKTAERLTRDLSSFQTPRSVVPPSFQEEEEEDDDEVDPQDPSELVPSQQEKEEEIDVPFIPDEQVIEEQEVIEATTPRRSTRHNKSSE